ncbi:hypothetical protein DUNSADRAFT_13844 [Dunaliella salina]|uniref:Encoded protein n=1 Tax=Dunaliella salina TaxID=3046 RepID=A0ABQ7G8G8_DUNSA|nr:hypothetical protein DUNSADRAFT_13844 [Dunaliella salina]|eukprot:KAF5830912.1 hypothetical protein DUNSADRAFT_13844 [Dunaliella salina]
MRATGQSGSLMRAPQGSCANEHAALRMRSVRGESIPFFFSLRLCFASQDIQTYLRTDEHFPFITRCATHARVEVSQVTWKQSGVSFLSDWERIRQGQANAASGYPGEQELSCSFAVVGVLAALGLHYQLRTCSRLHSPGPASVCTPFSESRGGTSIRAICD